MNTFYLPNLNHNFVGYFLSVTESDADQLEKKTFEKSFEIFLEICPLCINIFQTLMNRLQKKFLENRSEKWFFEVISIFVSIGQYMDQLWTKFMHKNPKLFFRLSEDDSYQKVFCSNRLKNIGLKSLDFKN